MLLFPSTFILRHRKENLKKCSLQGLEKRKDLCFLSYPWKDIQPDLQNYVILSLDAPILTLKDVTKGIFLIDGTWRYAEKMVKSLPGTIEKRSLPKITTAYPRHQQDVRGLASIEALYLAYLILGRDTEGLLDHYYWKENFLFNLKGF